MKYLISGFKHFANGIILSSKELFFKLSRNKFLKIKILENEEFKFLKKGELIRILYLSQHLLGVKKSFEYKTLSTFKKLLRPEFTVLDIGGNVGLFSILASKYVNNIIAFEPNPYPYDAFIQNLNENSIKNVKVEKIGLSDQPGTFSIHMPEDKSTDVYAYLDSEGKGEIKCQVNTLDQYILDNGISNVDLIKIDIEGGELACLNGAKNLLSKPNKPIIIFECNEDVNLIRYNYAVQDIFKLLGDLNYRILSIEENQWIAYDNLKSNPLMAH